MRKGTLLLLFAALVGVIHLVRAAEAEDELDRKIGRMIMVGFRGFEVEPSSWVLGDVRAGRVGGVVLFDYDVALGKAERNIRSEGQLRKLIAGLQAAAGEPLLIAIDQEGGRVNRLKERYGFPPAKSAEALAKAGGVSATREQARRTAETLAGLGINLNFAPVVDLRLNPANPVIAQLERSFSDDPSVVVRHASEWVRVHRELGIASTLKHFPGHGSSKGDSHLGFVDVTETWSPLELRPYEELIAAGLCDVVMTAHVFNSELDPRFPATLSSSTIDGILRDRLQFDGVVIADDLQMRAVSDRYGLENAIEAGLRAGLDILLFANNSVYDPEIAVKSLEIIRRLVREGGVSESRIDESNRRILRLKERYLR